MSSYAIFFNYNKKTYRLPANPEEISVSSNMATETYEVLRLGQVVVPTHMELKEYSFEVELPSQKYNYVETINKFKDADYYLNLFEKWRNKLVPVRFIASNGMTEDINALVLITDLKVTEKAGEEGDKYASFTLLEYEEYGKLKPPTVDKKTGTKQKTPLSTTNNPNNKGYYVVKAGDSLWNIAKKYYGNGAQYTQIYKANKDKIKNPNLIYPGQRLVIPK